MTFPHSPQPGPRPGPPSGGFRPGPPPVPAPAGHPPAETDRPAPDEAVDAARGESTGHPAVDAVLQSLANVAGLAPADQIAEYEAAHRVLQETLTSIDG